MEIKHLPREINSKLPFNHGDLILKPDIYNKSHNNEKDTSPIAEQKLAEHIEQMNKFIEPTKTTIRFQLHDKLNKYYVQVVDTYTEEVIREIPSKKFLDMYAATAELLGMLVDKKI